MPSGKPHPTLCIAQDPLADDILGKDPFAVLLGMQMDQQYPMEHAFRAGAKIIDRFGSLDPERIAEAEPEEFAAMASTTPAIHRFPGSMAAKVQALARIVVEEYGGHAERIWTEAKDGADLVKRVMALPGFGKQKAQIFTALVAKQLGVRPTGWEKAVGDYALAGYRSVADVTGPESLAKVREYKQAQKAAQKAKSKAATEA